MPWKDVVDGQNDWPLAAVLARIAVAAENLSLGELDARMGALNHVRKPDD
jgi:hypothetical protein